MLGTRNNDLGRGGGGRNEIFLNDLRMRYRKPILDGNVTAVSPFALSQAEKSKNSGETKVGFRSWGGKTILKVI